MMVLLSRKLVVLVFAAALSLGGCVVLSDMNLAKEAMDRGDYESAAEDYRKLADFGIPRANSELGRMYLTGQGVPKNAARAEFYFNRARAEGENTKRVAQSYYALGSAFEKGDGTDVNVKKAFEYYHKAAVAGYAKGYHAQGLIFRRGKLVERDMPKAVSLFEKAGAQGYNPAYKELATLYGQGKLVGKDAGKESYYKGLVR